MVEDHKDPTAEALMCSFARENLVDVCHDKSGFNAYLVIVLQLLGPLTLRHAAWSQAWPQRLS